MKTYYLYAGGTPIAEETWNGTAASFSALNGWSADGWRARLQGSICYQFAYDPQGCVVERQTDGAFSSGFGAYDQSTFEGYGSLRGAYKVSSGARVGQHDPVGFGGQYGYYTDTETGLLCLTHRYYDPGTGKFLTRDPMGYGGGVNLYGFCGGNPVNESDPFGTDADGLPTDSMQYVGSMFDRLTPHDYFHALKHNDTTRAVGMLLNIASYYVFPEAKGAALAGEGIVEIGGAAAKSAYPKFSGVGVELEEQLATWLGRKGAVVERSKIYKNIGGVKEIGFDGKIGKLMYEVKSQLHDDPANLSRDLGQFDKQANVARSLGKNYRIFIKGPVPKIYRKVLAKRGYNYTMLP